MSTTTLDTVPQIHSAQQLHLLVEELIEHDEAWPASIASGKKKASLEVLPVPVSPAALVVGTEIRPQFVDHIGSAPSASLIVEQVFNARQQPRLLVLNSSGQPLQLNGQSAPRLAVLKEKDVFQLNGSALLHVTILNRPMIGSPRADRVDTECPVCRVPLVGDAACYTCPCGVALHCDSTPDGLQCAQLRSECPRCGRHVNLKEGFTYWPEGDHE